MFNRHIQIKVVKPKKTLVEEVAPEEIALETYVIAETAKDMLQEVGKYVAAYILLDTFRKVAIALAERPK